MGEALSEPKILNFDHFEGQNTHFTHWSPVFMHFGDVFIVTSAKKWQGLVKILFGHQNWVF